MWYTELTIGIKKCFCASSIWDTQKEELIQVDTNGHVTLTEKVLGIAKSMYERHTALSGFLRSLGIPEKIATEDACRM